MKYEIQLSVSLRGYQWITINSVCFLGGIALYMSVTWPSSHNNGQRRHTVIRAIWHAIAMDGQCCLFFLAYRHVPAAI